MIEIFAQNHEVDFMEIDTLDCGLAFFPWLPKDDVSYMHDTPTYTITHIQKCNLALILPSFSTLFSTLQIFVAAFLRKSFKVKKKMYNLMISTFFCKNHH